MNEIVLENSFWKREKRKLNGCWNGYENTFLCSHLEGPHACKKRVHSISRVPNRVQNELSHIHQSFPCENCINLPRQTHSDFISFVTISLQTEALITSYWYCIINQGIGTRKTLHNQIGKLCLIINILSI